VDVAPQRAEHPVAHELVGQRERHDDQAEEEVADGQRRDEPVLQVLERLLGGDGDDERQPQSPDKDRAKTKSRKRAGDDDGSLAPFCKAAKKLCKLPTKPVLASENNLSTLPMF